MKLIITSEQRVGSRWMHYLFADLLGQSPSPEIGGHRFYNGDLDHVIGRVKKYFKEDRIPKFHGVGAFALYQFLVSEGIEDFGILGVVRNPYDRAVSLAFHNRYHKKHHFKQKDFDTDEDAVIWTATKDSGFLKSCIRQYSDLMLPHYSSYSNYYPEVGRIPYIWTTYKWLKEDTAGEIQTIIRTLNKGIAPRTQQIQEHVERHSFKKRSGRKEGKEKRSNLWHRKGIMGDHKNWFNEDCYRELEPHQYRYNLAVSLEKEGTLREIPFV